MSFKLKPLILVASHFQRKVLGFHMEYIQKYFYAIIITGLISTSVSVASEAEYHIGVALMKFDYDEYTDNNVFLDGESGFIPGVVLKRKQDHTTYYSEWVGQLHGNTINYDGQTQGGTPLTTKSDAVIFDTHFKLGFHFAEAQNHGLYFGLGYRYWFRNIRSGHDINGSPVAGLLEHYYWLYGLFGYAANYTVNENVNVGFDIRLTNMINAKMDIDFLGYNNYDNTQVNLGNRSGARFAVPIQIKTRNRSFIVSPYYEIIDIGRSNNVRVTSGGVPTTIEVYEPRSETRNVGIEITWLW